MKYYFFIFTLVALLWSNKLFAYDIAVENADGITIYYNYINDGKELEVTRKNDKNPYDNNSYSGAIVIPENVTFMNRTRKVTCISSAAFSGCDIESVQIPSSVSTIGRGAFMHCNKLVSISIPSGSIDSEAFTNCKALEKVVIGDGVKSIGTSVFSSCENLTTIVMGKSLEHIYNDAFKGCNKLDKVVVKDIAAWCNIEIDRESYLPRHLYSDESTEISDLIIPEGVRIIKERVFDDIYYLKQRFKTVTFPTTLESIEYQNLTLFNNTKVTIKDIAAWCNADVHQNEVYYSMFYEDGEPIKNLMIPDGVTSIKRDNFCGCISIESVSFPQSMKSIQGFRNCKNLTRIVLNEGVTNIGSSAFRNCNLSYLRIPRSVEKIEIDAFINENLSTVVSLIENPFDISEYTFSNNTIMNATLYVPKGTIDLYKNVNGWKEFKFVEELDSISSGETPDNPSGDDDPTSGSCGETVNYSYDKASQKLTISGKGAIYDYDNGSNKSPWSSYAAEIQKIELVSGITSIGYFAFYKCSGITSLSIPATVGYIGSSAFEDCTSITSLSLNEGLLNIGGSAFEGCTGLKTLSIPSTVNSISINAFKNCKGITDVYCYAGTVPDTHSDAFDGTPTEKSTLYVPANSVEAYKTSWPWSDFKNILAIGSTPSDDPTSSSCGETVNYSYAEATHTLTISGKGAIYDYDNVSNKAPWSSYADKIQKIEIESGITSIGYFAFYKCSSIMSLSIPATIGYIGSSAFEDCTGLTSLSLNDGLLYIGGSAFEGCVGLQTLTIPSTVNSISINAFKNCKGIRDVYCYAETVPDTHSDAFVGAPTESTTLHVPTNAVKAYRESWPWSGFKETVSLENSPIIVDTSIIDNGIIYIIKGDGTLEVTGLNKKMTTVEIPSSVIANGTEYQVTSIKERAFESQREITYISIPQSVTSIKEHTFNNCTNLTSVIIPNSVTTIGVEAFYGCTSLSYILIPNSVTSIDNGAFMRCTNLSSFTIPNSVITIGTNVFNYCSSLASIIIPNSVMSIGNNIFGSCNLASIEVESGNNYYDSRNNCNAIIETASNTLITGCKNSTIPNGVTSIGRSAFFGCSGLTYITIPNSVISIGSGAFEGTTWYNNQPDGLVLAGNVVYKYKGEMPNNTRIVIKDGTSGIAEDAFSNCANLTSVTIPNSVISIGSYAFKQCFGLTSITIPNNVTSINNGTFYNCRGLETVIIPNGVTSIGEQVFYGCKSLVSMTIPPNVTFIGSGAFRDCIGLTSVTIPNGVTSITKNTFWGCSSIKEIVIPKSVTDIEKYAFRGCLNLLDFYCYAKIVPTTYDKAFHETPIESVTLHVPVNSVEAYRTTWPWSDFKEIVAIREDPDAIMEIKQSENSNREYYDLIGRRVHYPQKGLYIRNGKKVIVK